MAKTLKRIDAGGIQIAALYDRCTGRELPAHRAAKKKASSDAQRRMNQIYSFQKLELMLATNFPTAGSALVCTLTFSDRFMPASRAECQRKFKHFREKLKRARALAGLPDPVIFWAPEILTSDSGRWHVHSVIDSTGDDMQMIRECWCYGEDIEIEKLRIDDDRNHETLARYMSKELREVQDYESKPGLRGWSCTRNAKRPEVETVTVPDSYELEVPSGCRVLIYEKKVTEFASYHILKYMYSAEAFRKSPRAKRRRRRRTR